MISITPFFHVYHKYVFIMSNINKIRLSGTTYNIQDLNATKTVELTQAEYDGLPTTAKTSNSLFVITDATAGDLSNYYTKSETSGATDISTALASKADTATTYTKTETDNAITAATSTKQDTLVSGTNIKTINNQSILGEGNITIQGGSGGGKAIEAGRGISITTGETADTVSFSLPISAGTGENSIVGLDSNTVNSKSSFAFGRGNTLNATSSYINNFAIGVENSCDGNSNFLFGQKNSLSLNNNNNVLIGYDNRCVSYYNNYNYIFGYNNVIAGVSHDNNILFGKDNTIIDNYISYSVILGNNNTTKNNYEVVTGRFNNSLSGSSTVGDGGNTLFSVGNGESESTRHNAFEIRQNGDIYIADTNNTSTTNYYEKPMIKLQDALGGGGTVDTEITSASTNPVTSAAIYNQFGGLKLVKLTKSEYDSLTTKDSQTLYIIVN